MRKKRILPHIVALIAALFIAGLPHGIGILPTDTVARAAEIDGIGATRERVRRGDTFDIVVNVPAVNAWADTVEIKIEYDPDVFTVTSWSPRLSSGNVMSNRDNSKGFVIVAAANAKVDLNYGMSFVATVKVNNAAKVGQHNILLTRADVSNYDTGYRWRPSTYSVPIKVTNDLVSISGKITANGVQGIATVNLIDRSGNKSTTTVNMTLNSSSGLYEGTYVFNEAESEETYTLETILPGCRTRSETIVVGSFSTTPDIRVNMVGDVDGDGCVGASDATQILRYIIGSRCVIKDGSGITDEYLYSVANVLSNGTLSVRDATQILRYVAGYSTVL